MYDSASKEGEIKSSRPWVDILTDKALKTGSQQATPSKVDSESNWTIGKIWGSGGIFKERGFTYVSPSSVY
jgi:hypothetical protein